MKTLIATSGNGESRSGKWGVGFFLVIQIGIMLVAVSNESLWIDEFWTAYFATVDSLGHLYEAIIVQSGSQTPLHFAYYYFWGLFFQPSEFALRLANLPLFVIGQVSLFAALRAYPKRFAYLFLAVSALHPMVWQYANEARPYIMMYAGSEMILAYMLHINATQRTNKDIRPVFLAMFVVGSVMLFGASMLGVFWVFVSFVYLAYFHYSRSNWRNLTRGASLLLVCLFLATTAPLTLYYLNSLLHGGGASRLSPTTGATLLFDAYELLGLSGVGPGRLELRDSGLSSLAPYWIWVVPAGAIVLVVLFKGLQEAIQQLGTRATLLVCALCIFPLAIVILSGFAMHWRVLGRHMIAELPILNLLFALGMTRLLNANAGHASPLRAVVAVAFLLVLVYSSCSLRFADRHRKDDYRAAAAIAQEELAKGRRVWWAADALGAEYYGLPGEFDSIGELTGVGTPRACIDRTGVQSITGAPKECLEMLSRPNLVILSKPEIFDNNGAIAAYLATGNFAKVQVLPAFTIWRAPES